MRLSPSSIEAYQRCPRAYWWAKVKHLRSSHTGIALVMGRAVDQTVRDYLTARHYGAAFDLVETFNLHWQNETEGEILPSKKWPLEAAYSTARELAEVFPDAWDDSGLEPLPLPNGKPALQLELSANVPDSPHVLFGFLDILAMDEDLNLHLIDCKTAAQSSAHALVTHTRRASFIEQSQQMIAYQALVQANRHALGVAGVDRVGFIEFIKLKTTGRTGPYIRPYEPILSHNPSEIDDYWNTVRFIGDAIEARSFPKFSRAAFDTPCRLCDYSGACIEGDEAGLVINPKTRGKRVHHQTEDAHARAS